MVSEKIKVRFIFRVNLCHLEQIKAFDRNFVFFKEFPGTVIKKIFFFFPIVLFNREYIYLEHLSVLLLFLGLKTHTFTEFTRK